MRKFSQLRLSRLLDWPERDKTILLALTHIPLIAAMLVWVWVTDSFTEFGRDYFQPSGVRMMYVFGGASIIGWLAILLKGLWLRAHNDHSSAYVLVLILYYGVSLLPLGYVLGIMAPITAVILLGATLNGFVLFGFPRVLGAFAINVVLIAVCGILSLNRVVEYAPLLSANLTAKSAINAYWMISQFVFCVPLITVAFLITYMLLTRWRDREAHAMSMSRTDILTGIPNRRAIMDIVKHELADTRRNCRPFAVVMIDIDHFKSINENYGEAAGDLVLSETANAVTSVLRESDWVGRYGGDQFVLVLPQADSSTAINAVERVQEALAKLSFDIGTAMRVRIKASLGVYSVIGDADAPTVEQVLKRADDALREAKDDGRNLYRVWLQPLEVADTASFYSPSATR
ncbi:MAG: GGDEF domain-containing protein [Alcanivoracaceae bacterium]|nr:GGDEF domain-containing protein [Alcanivoracaceae bacterium]